MATVLPSVIQQYLKRDMSAASRSSCSSDATLMHKQSNLGIPSRRSRIMTTDTTNGRRRTLINNIPILSSSNATWSNIIKLEHHQHCCWITEHCPDDYLIILFLTANVSIETSINGDWQPGVMLRAGDVTIHGRHTAIASRWHEPLEFLILSLDPALVARSVEEECDTAEINLKFSQGIQDQQIRQVMLALLAELREGCPSGRLYGEGLATALASHLLQCYAAAPTLAHSHRGGLSPAQLRRVLSYIDAHLGEKLSLSRLSALIQLSRYHFVRAFQQSTGRSPHRYVLEQRIARAQSRLMEPELSLADVGYELGFGSQAHFTTIFRKLVGTTPGAWRVTRSRALDPDNE